MTSLANSSIERLASASVMSPKEELADEVIGAGLRHLLADDLGHRARRPAQAPGIGDHAGELPGPRVHRRAAVLLEQRVEAVVPHRVRALGQVRRRSVGVGDHQHAAEPEFRHPAGATALGPGGAVVVAEAAGRGDAVEADDVEALLGATHSAVVGMYAVPDRRMRLLQRLHLHRYIVEAEMLALEAHCLLAQPLHDDGERLVVDVARLGRVGAVEIELDRRGTPAEADIEPAAAHLIEHADFLDHAKRVIKRQRVDHRSEPQPLGALRHRRQEHARRRRHAERCPMVLGDVIGVKAGAVVKLDAGQPLLVVVRLRRPAGVDVIEDSEFHRGLR